MTTTVIINDFEHDSRSLVIFGDDDIARVEENWESEDRLLVELQSNEFFFGKTRWCDLTPTHFRLLIMQNLTHVSKLSAEDQTNENHPTVLSLHFLIMSLIKTLETRAECSIELLRINRISTHEVAYDYTACLNMAFDPPKPKNGLRVIIDNT